MAVAYCMPLSRGVVEIPRWAVCRVRACVSDERVRACVCVHARTVAGLQHSPTTKYLLLILTNNQIKYTFISDASRAPTYAGKRCTGVASEGVIIWTASERCFLCKSTQGVRTRGTFLVTGTVSQEARHFLCNPTYQSKSRLHERKSQVTSL